MAGGRPTKLTREIREKIVEAIRAGAYLETAAALAGIDRVTLHRWLKAGARQKRGELWEFCNAVEKALAEAEMDDLYIIKRAAQENWQAAAWRLERKFPERWGRKDRLQAEISGPGGEPLKIIIDVPKVPGITQQNS